MAVTWTKDSLRVWIRDCDPTNVQHRAALTRALLYLYARQTADERSTRATSHANGAGFTSIDANFLTSVARGAERFGSVTERQAAVLARRLPKYAGQLLALVNAPATATAPAPAVSAPAPSYRIAVDAGAFTATAPAPARLSLPAPAIISPGISPAAPAAAAAAVPVELLSAAPVITAAMLLQGIR